MGRVGPEWPGWPGGRAAAGEWPPEWVEADGEGRAWVCVRAGFRRGGAIPTL